MHSSLPIRLARPAPSPAGWLRICALAGAFATLLSFVFLTPAHAQSSSDLGFMYTQERTKFVGSDSSDFFYLRGATVDYAYTLSNGIGLAINGTGLAVTNLRTSIDIHQVTLLVGPRYTYNLGRIMATHEDRKGSAYVEGKFGYTFATAGQFPDSTGFINSSAASLTYAGGAGLNLHFYHRFDLRLIDVHLIRTQLPNGSSNVQNTLAISSGVNFHFGP